MGIVSASAGDEDTAVRCFLEAASGFERLGKREAQAFCLAAAGQARLDARGFMGAAEAIGAANLLDKALKLYEQAGNTRRVAEVASTLGRVWMRADRPLDAVEIFSTAIRCAEASRRATVGDAYEG